MEGFIHWRPVPLERGIRSINIRAIRLSCVEACLDAMLAERRFTYTDLFLKGKP